MGKLNEDFLEAIERSKEFDIVVSELSGGIVADFPTWNDFKESLSGDYTDEDGERVALYKKLKPFFRKLGQSKDGAGRYHIWQTGTYRMDFHMEDRDLGGLGMRKRYYRKPID